MGFSSEGGRRRCLSGASWNLAVLTLAPALSQAQTPPLTRIAFGSCADEEKPQPIWDAVLATSRSCSCSRATTSTATCATGAHVPEAT